MVQKTPQKAKDITPNRGKRPDPPTADRVLGVAADLFRRKGYATSSTRELSELLDINKATLYHHINSKEDLLLAICRESLTRISSSVGETAETAPPDTRLAAMIRTHLTCAVTDRDMHVVMLAELRALSPAASAEIINMRADYEAILRRAIAADQAEGRLRSDIDAKRLTLALLNLLNWTIFWFDPSGAQTPEELSDWLVTIFLDGARARPTRR
jgi:AcrR family transcriptional regulator